MKRLLLSVAVLAVAASCSKNEVDLPQTDQIGFSTLNSNVTKVANDVASGVDYKVYACVQKGQTAPTGWLINDVVDGTSNEADNGPYFWPASADETVSFYSYAPSDATVAIETEACPTVVFDYTVPADAQEDFTMATLSGQTATTAAATAKFTFAHKLSKVTVKVVLTEALKTAGYALQAGSESAITVNENTADVRLTDNAFTAVKTIKPTPVTYDVDATNTYYIMPQATLGCKIQLQNLEVKHTASGVSLFGGAVDLEEIVLGAAAMNTKDFESGKHYVVTVTVGGDAKPEGGNKPLVILFSADEASWGTDVEVGVNQPSGN